MGAIGTCLVFGMMLQEVRHKRVKDPDDWDSGTHHGRACKIVPFLTTSMLQAAR
tara:strand:- start:2486 stop:2647 length:162 start_codon:yes stop_codon:yes gene_type:complete